jgi:undecaprenyl-diphosphatase
MAPRGSLRALDRRALLFLRTRCHGPRIERAALVYATAGESGALWIVLSLGGAALDSGRRGRWLGVTGIVPVALSANYLVKRAVRRPRPRVDGLPRLGRRHRTDSFPSGHAATSFAAATSIAGVRPSLGPTAFAGAALMALTRPYLGVHYPSDVAAGAALGALLGAGLRAAWRNGAAP